MEESRHFAGTDFRQGDDQYHLSNHHKVLTFHGLVLSVVEKKV
jgi:hypothetical protein